MAFDDNRRFIEALEKSGDVVRIKNIEPSHANPFLSPEENEHHMGAKVIFDCTWPIDWGSAVPGRVSFHEMYPQEIKERVIKNWENHGFD